jgi:Cytochrome c5
MNTPEHNVDKSAEHEGLIKTPKQLIVTIVLAFIIPIAVILLLIRLVTASTPLGVGSDAHSQEAVAKRIQPVAGFALVTAETGGEERTGDQVFASTCAACHGTGVAGAPKVGDSGAWSPLIAKGFDTLVKHAIEGFNAMPPRGGNPKLTDLEVARGVAHMANQSGANFPEPESAGGASEGAADAGKQAQAAPAQANAAQTAAAQAPAAAAAAAAGAQAQQSASKEQPAQAAAPKEAAAGGDNIDLAAGEKLYKSACFACHGTGVAGAPKLGDKATWAPRIAEGMDKMVKIAIEGKGAMPPRGGSTASDADITAAVHYMVNASK